MLVHRHQQHTTGIPMELPCALQELNAVHPGQMKTGGHQCHSLTSLSELLERVERGPRVRLGYHPVIDAVAPAERLLDRCQVPRVIVNHK
jgi:hypothetical protein